MGLTFSGNFGRLVAFKTSRTPVAWNIRKFKYDDVYLDVSAQDTFPHGIVFNADGTKLFLVGQGNRYVYQYDLPTPYSIVGASYSGNSLYVGNKDVWPEGLAFNADGTRLFVVGNNNDSIFQYDLTTSYDLSTASYVTSLSVSSKDTSPLSITFNSDGTKLFVLGDANEYVNEYNMTTPYDLSTATYSNNFYIGNQDVTTGLAFSNDGSKMFITGLSTKRIYSYDLIVPYDITTCSYRGNYVSINEDDWPQGLAFSSDGKRLLVVGSENDRIHQYSAA